MRLRRDLRRGFTLIELMIVVAIMALLAAVAIPAFKKYVRRSHTIEATMNVRVLFDSSTAYYASERTDTLGTILAKQFPVAVTTTPTTHCCAQVGEKCLPNLVDWQQTTWQSLHFAVTDPFLYVYKYDSSGTGQSSTFNAQSFGDLDCDGSYSTFARSGKILSDLSVSGGGLFVKDDIE